MNAGTIQTGEEKVCMALCCHPLAASSQSLLCNWRRKKTSAVVTSAGYGVFFSGPVTDWSSSAQLPTGLFFLIWQGYTLGIPMGRGKAWGGRHGL